MNLNPLKKDDNTDALVKALEDANEVGAATQQPATDATNAQTTAMANNPSATDSAMIANDPQINGSAMPNDPAVDSNTNTSGADPNMQDTTADVVTDAQDDEINEPGMPAGMSSDANAHLPNTGETGELDSVKKNALEQLRPLIEKIDLEPSDKFDKYLMMLRASDDPALIKPAFEAAQGISGEKEKAQALLDIINEINYITSTQQQNQTGSA